MGIFIPKFNTDSFNTFSFNNVSLLIVSGKVADSPNTIKISL